MRAAVPKEVDDGIVHCATRCDTSSKLPAATREQFLVLKAISLEGSVRDISSLSARETKYQLETTFVPGSSGKERLLQVPGPVSSSLSTF